MTQQKTLAEFMGSLPAGIEDTSILPADTSNTSVNGSAGMPDTSILPADTSKRPGGRARMAKMTAEERSALARRAIKARWDKRNKKTTIGFAAAKFFNHE